MYNHLDYDRVEEFLFLLATSKIQHFITDIAVAEGKNKVCKEFFRYFFHNHFAENAMFLPFFGQTSISRRSLKKGW
jgi:hypothetical protein